MTTQKFAYVFPGQGSQSVGMLADIAEQFSEVKTTFDEASQVLGYDLWQLVKEGPAEELDKTIHTQPALLTASYAIWRILQTQNPVKPNMLAGHSLGEYTALVCANALDFKDAVKSVAARGQYMQDAVPVGQGAMAAIIGLDESQVVELCKKAASNNEVLSPANFNSIGQIVIAGNKESVERAVTLAKEMGAKMAVPIPVSVPSHCALMKPAAEKLAEMLATTTFKSPEIPVLRNIDASAYENSESIRNGLTQQLFMPVRWVDVIQQFSKAGITHIVECGPGKVLTGLSKRIDKNLQLMTTLDLTNLNAVLAMENSNVT